MAYVLDQNTEKIIFTFIWIRLFWLLETKWVHIWSKQQSIKYIIDIYAGLEAKPCLLCMSVCGTWSWNLASLPTLFVLHLLFKRFSFFDSSTQLAFEAHMDKNMDREVNRTNTQMNTKTICGI